MSDLEVDQPQLFDILRKANGRRPKRYKGRVPARKARFTPKVKKLKLSIRQPAAVQPTPSDTADQGQRDLHFVAQSSFHPRVFQGAPRSSLSSIGPNFNPSSSTSELVRANNHQVAMFQVNIPARGYHITPSQNPKRRTIFEEPLYTNDGDFPMVNRTSELVRKNLVAPMWSELSVEDDLARHGQQFPTHTEEAMEVVDSKKVEVRNDLKDDRDILLDDEHCEMDMNIDSTGR